MCKDHIIYHLNSVKGLMRPNLTEVNSKNTVNNNLLTLRFLPITYYDY